MPTKSNPKPDHNEMRPTNLKFAVDYFLLLIGAMLPGIMVQRIFRFTNTQMPMWIMGPLLVLGFQLSPALFRKIFLVSKPEPIQMNIRDLIVINPAIWIFFFVSFAPINASNENSCGFIFMTFISGAALALGFGYLFGTAELRKQLRYFPRNFKRAKQKK